MSEGRRPSPAAPSLATVDSKGRTPLINAARTGSAGAVRLLLSHGSPVGVQDSEGRTALMYAAKAGSMAAVMLLLDAGEPLQAKDAQGRSALAFAVMSGNEEVMQLLVDCGADTRVVDGFGDDLVCLASKAGHYGPLRLALELAQRETGSVVTDAARDALVERVSKRNSPGAGQCRSPSVSTSVEASGRTRERASAARSPSLSAIVRSSSRVSTPPDSSVRSLASIASASHRRGFSATTQSEGESDESLEFALVSPTAMTRPRSLSFDRVAGGDAGSGESEGTPVSAPLPTTSRAPESAVSSSSDEAQRSWGADAGGSYGSRLLMPPRWTPARNGFPVTPGSNATSWVASSLHKHMVAASSPRPQRMDPAHVTPGLLSFNVMDNPLMEDTPPSSEHVAAQQGFNRTDDNRVESEGKGRVQMEEGRVGTPVERGSSKDSSALSADDVISADMMMAALASPTIRSEVFQVITNTPHLLQSVARQEGGATPVPLVPRDACPGDENDAPVQVAGLFTSAKKSARQAAAGGAAQGSHLKPDKIGCGQPSAPSTAQRAISCPPPHVPFSPGAELWNQMLGASDDSMEEELQLFEAPPELPPPTTTPLVAPHPADKELPQAQSAVHTSSGPGEAEQQAEILSVVHQILLPHQVMSSGLSKEDFQKIAADVARVVLLQRKKGSPANLSITPAKAERRRIENLVDKYVERAQTRGATSKNQDPGPSQIPC